MELRRPHNHQEIGVVLDEREVTNILERTKYAKECLGRQEHGSRKRNSVLLSIFGVSDCLGFVPQGKVCPPHFLIGYGHEGMGLGLFGV